MLRAFGKVAVFREVSDDPHNSITTAYTLGKIKTTNITVLEFHIL
jgi:hypothetical protein